MADGGKSGAERRNFLRQAGAVAIATPPVLALLLSAEGRHYAMALSGSGNKGNHYGQGKNGNNGNHYGQGKNGNNGNQYGRGG